MKAYLFIETGEVRQVKNGEYYLADGDVMRRDLSYPTDGAYTIVTRHEIPIPEGAENFNWDFDHKVFRNSQFNKDWGNIPIPRPKKKVKKWRCVLSNPFIDDGGIFISSKAYSDDEISKLGNIVQKINSTEIEVEE